MKIAVAGLWHLGVVTAACLAKAGFEVLGYDAQIDVIAKLKNNQAPLFEPGLEALLIEGRAKGKLSYTSDAHALITAEIIWVTYDTPVDNDDCADVEYVVQNVNALFPYLQQNALVIVSSQVPVGTISMLQTQCHAVFPEKNITFACIPENLRLGKAIEVFTKPDRIVVGLDVTAYKKKLETVLQPFSTQLIWMSIVSAEMTKHAINAFLALSVTFINEISALCETVGANGSDVERGLKSEERIGEKAYLRPGAAIAGGTLLRDINYLMQLGKKQQRNTFLVSAIAESNLYHKQWACRKLLNLLDTFKGKKIALLGLTYKAGTDTLRRSTAIEISQWLHQQGALVSAYDPIITQLPTEYARCIDIQATVEKALESADAVVVSTEWPQFRELTADIFYKLKQPFVLDASGFISKNLANDSWLQYFSVGMPS